jgi:hypothetical protein
MQASPCQCHAGHRQHQAFGEQLHCQATPVGADYEPDGDFAAARAAARTTSGKTAVLNPAGSGRMVGHFHEKTGAVNCFLVDH